MDIMPKVFAPFGIKSSYSGKESVKPVAKKVTNAKVFGASTPNRVVWSVGDKVNHEKYGEGTIIGIEDGIELTIVFKNVDYGIFAQSFKSEIIVLQSIGRGLLKTETKNTFPLYDIIDILPTKRLYVQGLSKIKTYKERDFEYNIISK